MLLIPVYGNCASNSLDSLDASSLSTSIGWDLKEDSLSEGTEDGKAFDECLGKGALVCNVLACWSLLPNNVHNKEYHTSV